jgi:hypothetical protein
MAFVPEDGTGLQDANSLVSVSYADEYFADRANAAWAKLTTEKKQASLLLATTYVVTQYSFKGQRLNPDQGVPFPRAGVMDPAGRVPAGVPACVKDVTCELAIRASTRALIQDPTVDEGGRPVKMKQMRAGPLHKTVEFAGPGELLEMSRFPAVDAMMCPWLIKQEFKFDNGVKMAPAEVAGAEMTQILQAAQELDRYTGPMNEDGKDIGGDDGTIPF